MTDAPRRRLSAVRAVLGFSVATGAVIAGLFLSGAADSPFASSKGRTEHGHGDGPLEGEGPLGFRVTDPVGTVFTNGMMIVRNMSGDPVVIEAVRPVINGDLEYLGASALGTQRPLAAVQYDRAWPPTNPDLAGSVPVEGLVIPPVADGEDNRGVELLLGYRILSAERATVPEVIVDYRAGDRRWRGRFTNTMALCPGADPDDDEACPFENGGET